MSSILARGVDYDPLRDKSYQRSRLGAPLADFLAWMELGGAAERTLLDYEWVIGSAPSSLCRLYPTKSIEEITDAEMGHVLRGFPAASRRTRKAPYETFFKWAVRTRRIERNPMDTLPLIRRRPQRYIDVFSDAEMEALVSLPLIDGALMAVLFDAGLRKGEARRLQLRHFDTTASVDGQHGRVIVLAGKGGKDRVIPATARIARMLSELALLDGLRPTDHLWYSVRANDVSRRVVRSSAIGEGTFVRWWARCLDDAQVRYRNPHTARHTFATRWLRRGGRLETLSIAMGHTSIKTTFDGYAHLITRDIALDVALVEGEMDMDSMMLCASCEAEVEQSP